MEGSAVIQALDNGQNIVCVVLLGILLFRGFAGRFKALTALLVLNLASSLAYPVLQEMSSLHLIGGYAAYTSYFYMYWTLFALQAIAKLGVVFELYQMAMAPLPGLQRLGKLVFRWAVAIALCIALGVALEPHTVSQSPLLKATGQLQQTESILTLCLLLFVAIASQPLGISFRHRIFGVSLGLGMLSVAELVQVAWLSKLTTVNTIGAHLPEAISVLSTTLWLAYFVMPEPKRQMIILPTTSPFLRWNQIAQALGDAPGFVAVGGFDPSFLAPAEVEIMERASLKMTAMEAKPVIAFEHDRREAVGA